MDNISILGYKERTFDEIKSDVLKDIKEIEPQLEVLPASLIDNFINCGVVLLKQNEGLSKTLFNSISLNSSDPFFDITAQDYGMNRHQEAKAQVTIKITSSKFGYIIPSNTAFTNTEKSVKFYNIKPIIINSLGESIFTAYSDNLESELSGIGVGDINQPLLQDTNISSVSNIDLPQPPRDIEDFFSFKKRIQERMRSLISGSLDNLINAIKNVDGVNPLQVKTIQTYSTNDTGSGGVEKFKAIECIIGGGDSYDIAYTLSQFMGLSPLFLISQPSNGESTRTITTTITQGYNSFDIVFTRPKIQNLEITFQPKLYNVITTNQNLELALKDYIYEIFSRISINQKINQTFLRKIFLDCLIEKYNYKAENIVSVSFNILIDGSPASFDSNGFIQQQTDDSYYILSSFNVSIQS